jgi:colanic acid/amylovoran biosynthesis glycosyltransferase
VKGLARLAGRGRRTPRPLRIAYLCDRYPAISHTFILREVVALRALGVEIDTISIRRSDPAHLLAEIDRTEFARTFAVLPVPPLTLLATHARLLLTRPHRYLDMMLLALALRRPGLRGLLWQLFYAAEAGLVWAHCARRGAHHLHAQFTTPAADVALLAARLGGPGWSWSFAAHGTDIFEADRDALAEKVRRAQFVVCVSDFGRSQLMMLVDEDHWDKIHVVPCGIDPGEYSPASRDGPAPGERLNVLVVGRLVPVKGHAVLLEAIARLRRTGTMPVSLEIVGDGPLRNALESKARALGLGEHATFHGRVGQDDIRRHYAAADVFCLPSFGEGVPVVLMEAMAMEIPVVASRVMGIPELVEDGASGLLLRPGRAEPLAEALARLAASPDLRRCLGRAGRARIESAFSLERSAQNLRDVYLSECGSATPDAGRSTGGSSTRGPGSAGTARGRLARLIDSARSGAC